jgi:hypothetical protein
MFSRARIATRVRRMSLAATCAVTALGCGDALPVTCARPATAEAVAYRGGGVEADVYMSADWEGDLLFFPGGAYYEIYHGLGEKPRWWQAYLSFERDGLTSASVALAAGNQAELKAIDNQSLTLLNGSCADYWLLVAAGGAASTAP